ncbi:MAG: dihydrofolate reductase family protein [Ignavibacteriaceae bacterium]
MTSKKLNMRKVILFIATSLDSYIASKDGSVDWLFTDGDYGTAAFMKTIDTILMGRKTYEQAVEFGLDFYKGKKIYVFTKSKKLKTANGCEIINEDAISFTKKLIRRKGKNIWLMGGGELASSFQKKNLIDEFSFFVHPILLGDGIPLFNNLPKISTLQLESYKRFDSGLIRINYSK